MTQKEEQEANQFALELLMPEELFIAEAKKIREKLYSGVNQYRFHSVDGKLITKEDLLINRLAKKCQVSKSTVKARMINLGMLTSI